MAKKKEEKDKKDKKKYEYRHEIVGIVYILFSIVGILGSSKMGLVGGLISSFSMFLVGTLYNVLLLVFLIIGVYLIVKRKYPNFFSLRLLGFYVGMLGLLTFMHMTYIEKNSLDVASIFQKTIDNFMIANENTKAIDGGGIIGATVSYLMVTLFSIDGGKIVAIVLIGIGSLVFLNISIVKTYQYFTNKVKSKYNNQKEKRRKNKLVPPVKKEEKLVVTSMKETEVITPIPTEEDVIVPKEEINLVSDEISNETVVERIHKKTYRIPGISILNNTVTKKDTVNKEEVKTNIERLERVLNDFDIVGKVVLVHIGPTVTQYELELKSGTKVSKIVNLHKEIALALACKDVRIQAPIPGKSTIGIELANKKVTPVGIREILSETPTTTEGNNYLSVALGKDIMGKSIYYNLDKAPHLLVAGSTGSGKSVCINSIIISILTRTKPDEVRLVLVDPKKVELSGYNGVPHLMTPVVTDPKKASLALCNIVNEMERRYNLFSDHNVKNITSYNDYINKKNEQQEEKLPNLPYIVVIIDELADLMLVAAKEVENSIMRITQMARAAGIHLIVATQRPSTDVITGVVKANIPSRLSFSVSSSIDSRTILDMTGAEKLLGKGDMLFFPTGESAPTRIQGCYVSDEEIKKVVDYVCNEQQANYDENIISSTGTESLKLNFEEETEEKYDDPLYNEIVEFAISTGKISASLIQRKYRLGYNRAARIIDLLEERGVIGGANGSKPREVLIKQEEE